MSPTENKGAMGVVNGRGVKKTPGKVPVEVTYQVG